jgi:hypothetical protein
MMQHIADGALHCRRALRVTRFPDSSSEVLRLLESLGACVCWLTPDGVHFANLSWEVTRFPNFQETSA